MLKNFSWVLAWYDSNGLFENGSRHWAVGKPSYRGVRSRAQATYSCWNTSRAWCDIILDFTLMFCRGIKFVSRFFITTPLNNSPKAWSVCCPGMLLDHLDLSQNFQIVPLFLHKKNMKFDEISWNLSGNSVSTSQIIRGKHKISSIGFGRSMVFASFFFYILAASPNLIGQKGRSANLHYTLAAYFFFKTVIKRNLFFFSWSWENLLVNQTLVKRKYLGNY